MVNAGSLAIVVAPPPSNAELRDIRVFEMWPVGDRRGAALVERGVENRGVVGVGAGGVVAGGAAAPAVLGRRVHAEGVVVDRVVVAVGEDADRSGEVGAAVGDERVVAEGGVV